MKVRALVCNKQTGRVHLSIEADTQEAIQARFSGKLTLDSEEFELVYLPTIDSGTPAQQDETICGEGSPPTMYGIEKVAVHLYREAEPLGPLWQHLDTKVRSEWFRIAEAKLNSEGSDGHRRGVC